MYQNLVLWVWLEFISPLKGTRITIIMVILDFNTLSGTQPQILTGTTITPVIFIWKYLLGVDVLL